MKKFAHIEDLHRRIFAAMLANMDDSVGEVLNTVNTLKLSERTLIVFISDNGGPTRELTSDNGPLRGEKGHVHEGGIRVPFLMQWTNHLPAGEDYREPVISLDIYATMAELAGATIPRNKALDGVNLLPFLQGTRKSVPHETLFWRSMEKSAFRAGDWKAVRNPYRGQGADWELYNLRADIGEQDDLKSQYPDRLKNLIDGWQIMNAEMIDPLW
jgi:arylsulfatase B